MIEVELKINELAKSVIPNHALGGFNELPLKDKVFGIKFFATMANDDKVIEMCEYLEVEVL